MKLGLILGDQLSLSLATLSQLDKSQDILVMAEVPQEAQYVKHHQQKIALVFSAMRHHAEVLREKGWSVLYFKYDEHAFNSLCDVLLVLCEKHHFECFSLT